MANNFQRGDFVPVYFQASGLAMTTLNIKSHTLDLESLIHDVTHTGHGGYRARIAGVEDAAGTVNADTDLDSPPWGAQASGTAPNIRNGVSGFCRFYMGNPATYPNAFFLIPVIIPKLHFESGVESAVKHSFDVKMNRIVGLPVYPAIS